LAQRQSVATSELGGQALIVMETGTNLRGFVERVLGDVEPPCAISLELDNVEAIKKMIEAQLGVSLLPRIAVREEATAGRLVALDLEDAPHAFRPISAVYRRDKHLTASLKAFLAMLREALSALPT
jgi:DNA-binding transcriptional LysR family regulator